MAWPMKFKSQGGVSLNCKREDNPDGIQLIKCEPLEKRDDVVQNLGQREVQFRVLENGKVELLDDGGVNREIVKELDDYLNYFVAKH